MASWKSLCEPGAFCVRNGRGTPADRSGPTRGAPPSAVHRQHVSESFEHAAVAHLARSELRHQLTHNRPTHPGQFLAESVVERRGRRRLARHSFVGASKTGQRACASGCESRQHRPQHRTGGRPFVVVEPLHIHGPDARSPFGNSGVNVCRMPIYLCRATFLRRPRRYPNTDASPGADSPRPSRPLASAEPRACDSPGIPGDAARQGPEAPRRYLQKPRGWSGSGRATPLVARLARWECLRPRHMQYPLADTPGTRHIVAAR